MNLHFVLLKPGPYSATFVFLLHFSPSFTVNHFCESSVFFLHFFLFLLLLLQVGAEEEERCPLRRGLSPGIKAALHASSVLLLAPPAAPSSDSCAADHPHHGLR